jgi:hypothetical protein
MPIWMALMFIGVGLWGAIVATFPGWARNLGTFNSDNWWTQTTS